MKFTSLPFWLEYCKFCLGLVPRQIDGTFPGVDNKSGTFQQNLIIESEQHMRVEECYASVASTNLMNVKNLSAFIRLVLSKSNTSHENKDFLLGLGK
jgi:hypothetical protein